MGITAGEVIGTDGGAVWATGAESIAGRAERRPPYWLVRGEEGSWRRVLELHPDAEELGTDLRLADDGSLWVFAQRPVVIGPNDDVRVVMEASDPVAIHVVGDTWSSFERSPSAGTPTVGPDGSLWWTEAPLADDGRFVRTRSIVRYDDGTLTHYAVPARNWNDTPSARIVGVTDDGSAWLTVERFTYGRDGRPDGLYVLDPSTAVPLSSESVEVTTGSLLAADDQP